MLSREITYHPSTGGDSRPVLRRTLFFRKKEGDPPVSKLVESTIFTTLSGPHIQWDLDLDLLEYLSQGLPPDLQDALPLPPRLSVDWNSLSILTKSKHRGRIVLQAERIFEESARTP